MKRILKSNLQFDDGYILDGDEIIALPAGVRCQLLALEEMVEYAVHEREVKGKSEVEKTQPFKPSTIDVEAHIKVDTPLLDKKEAEGKALIQEVKLQSLEKKINKELASMQILLNWVDSKYIIVGDGGLSFGENRMSLPVIGNPLELTVSDIVGWVVAAFDTEDLLEKAPDEVIDLRVGKE